MTADADVIVLVDAKQNANAKIAHAALIATAVAKNSTILAQNKSPLKRTFVLQALELKYPT